MATCKGCSLPVAGDSLYTCSGLCKCDFHFTCLGVSRAVALELKRQDSPLLWMCQDCRSGSTSGWESIRDLITNTMAEMKRELGESLARLTLPPGPSRASSSTRRQHPARPPATTTSGLASTDGTHTPTRAGEPVATNTAKRRLVARSPPDSDPAPRIIHGTATIQDPSVQLTVPPRFWLYLTNIAPSVSDDVVDRLVKQQLGSDDVIIRKLVKRDRVLSTATFISFKVGMSLQLRDKALSPSTWPQGVGFREFEDYGAPVEPEIFRVAPPPATAPPILKAPLPSITALPNEDTPLDPELSRMPIDPVPCAPAHSSSDV